ncbi:MAG: hypothetical protein V1870_03565 [Candidatus Aenigmatarchaeota archaeon]
MPEYSIDDIDNAIYSGNFLVWIDDKSRLPTTKEYLARNTMYIAYSQTQGKEFCKTMHAIERIVHGRADIRYWISGQGNDIVCSEDLDERTAYALMSSFAYALMSSLISPRDAPLPPGMI